MSENQEAWILVLPQHFKISHIWWAYFDVNMLGSIFPYPKRSLITFSISCHQTF